jgi:hypothetical protein
MSTPETADALEAIERSLADGRDADDALRRVVTALRKRMGYDWVGILFVEAGGLQLGPGDGEPDESRRTQVDVRWRGDRVAELAVDGAAPGDRPLLEQVATRIAGHCLVGWDTGGEPWDG